MEVERVQTRVAKILILAGGVLALFALSRCVSVRYADDTAFLNSAQANSPEFPASINGRTCSDMDGVAGLCSKRVRSNVDLEIILAPMPYAYTADVRCTKELGVSGSFTVLADTAFKFKIPASAYSLLPVGVNSFICVGKILPMDRPEPIAAAFKVFATVTDALYTERETLQLVTRGKKTYLVPGQYARIVKIRDGGTWKTYREKTVYEVKDSKNLAAFSESYQMRYNTYGDLNR